MTTDQKQAIMVLMNLYNDEHIDEEQYFLLLDFVLGNSDKELEVIRTPFVQWQPQCCEPNGVCTNPFHDCINCPRQFGGGNYTITTNKAEEQK